MQYIPVYCGISKQYVDQKDTHRPKEMKYIYYILVYNMIIKLELHSNVQIDQQVNANGMSMTIKSNKCTI